MCAEPRGDENGKLFDELDILVEIASGSVEREKRSGAINPKYYTSPDMINLMIEEVPIGDVRIYQQIGGSWVAEVKYRGITFVAVDSKKRPNRLGIF